MKMSNMAIMKSNMAAGDGEIVKDVGYSSAGLSDKPEGMEYPYCLKLYLGHEEIKKLGLSELPSLGAVIDMMAKVKVVGQRLDKDAPTMEIQIIEMGLGSKKKDPEVALYDKEVEED